MQGNFMNSRQMQIWGICTFHLLTCASLGVHIHINHKFRQSLSIKYSTIIRASNYNKNYPVFPNGAAAAAPKLIFVAMLQRLEHLLSF